MAENRTDASQKPGKSMRASSARLLSTPAYQTELFGYCKKDHRTHRGRHLKVRLQCALACSATSVSINHHATNPLTPRKPSMDSLSKALSPTAGPQGGAPQTSLSRRGGPSWQRIQLQMAPGLTGFSVRQARSGPPVYDGFGLKELSTECAGDENKATGVQHVKTTPILPHDVLLPLLVCVPGVMSTKAATVPYNLSLHRRILRTLGIAL